MGIKNANTLGAVMMDQGMMELAISGAIGGIAGEAAKGLVSGMWGSGKKWLGDQFKDHPPKAQDAALQNAVDFSRELAVRMESLEETQINLMDRIDLALADPDYTYLLHNALIASARTSSEEKHRLLARLVSDRLTAEPDSLRTLAAHMACNAIPQLSPVHLRFLGVMAVIHILKPPSQPEGTPIYDIRDRNGNWLLSELSDIMPIGDMTNFDYVHLVAVSCITYIPPEYPKTPLEELTWSSPTIGEPESWDLRQVLQQKFPPNGFLIPMFIENTSIGKELIDYWYRNNMRMVSLTSAGALIGMYVRDMMPKRDAEWNF